MNVQEERAEGYNLRLREETNDWKGESGKEG
jgi:hypothetical protein